MQSRDFGIENLSKIVYKMDVELMIMYSQFTESESKVVQTQYDGRLPNAHPSPLPSVLSENTYQPLECWFNT